MKKPKKCYDVLCISVLQQIVSKKESKCENNLTYYSNGSLSVQVCAVFSPNCLGALFCQVKVRIDPNVLLVHFQRWKSRSAARVCELAFVVVFTYRKHTRSSSSNATVGNIENEYIRNLQQQIYFLELEANYLYPFIDQHFF